MTNMTWTDKYVDRKPCIQSNRDERETR